MELEYLKWISTPEENQELLDKFGVKYLEGVYPPLGHVFSVTLEKLSRAGTEITLEEFLEGWNHYIEIGGCGYAKVTVSDFLKPVNYLQVNRLRWFLRDLGLPSKTIWGIIKKANGGWLR